VAGFDAKEFFELGKRIVMTEANEAGYRTAINRAYYACHLVGCVTVGNKGWFKRTYRSDDHQALCRTLESRTRWGRMLRSVLSRGLCEISFN